MTTPADYTERLVDVAAYVGAVEAGEVLLTQELAGPTNFGQIMTGAQKIAQRFILRLFTIKGSLLYEPTEGCDFLRDILENQLRSVPEIFGSFARSLVDIQNSFAAETTTDDPGDEVYADAQLTSVEIFGDRLVMHVQLEVASGETLPVILPLPIVV